MSSFLFFQSDPRIFLKKHRSLVSVEKFAHFLSFSTRYEFIECLLLEGLHLHFFHYLTLLIST